MCPNSDIGTKRNLVTSYTSLKFLTTLGSKIYNLDLNYLQNEKSIDSWCWNGYKTNG